LSKQEAQKYHRNLVLDNLQLTGFQQISFFSNNKIINTNFIIMHHDTKKILQFGGLLSSWMWNCAVLCKFIDPYDGDSIVVRNVGRLLTGDMVSHTRRELSL